MLRHVVLFGFKNETTPEQVQGIVDAFRALPSKVSEIAGFEWGANVSPENLAQGFTHCFFVTFKGVADRDAYLPHPAHQEFVSTLGPHLERVLVLDYEAQK